LPSQHKGGGNAAQPKQSAEKSTAVQESTLKLNTQRVIEKRLIEIRREKDKAYNMTVNDRSATLKQLQNKEKGTCGESSSANTSSTFDG
jgi:hypothetical protein